VTTSLTDFAAGHSFDPIVIKLEPERVRAYCDATADSCSLYEDANLVPPLALAAFALGALLNEVGLPAGTLHVNESLEFRGAVAPDATVECRARLAQRSARGGMIVSALDSELVVEGETVLTARATVFCPAPGS
jgi:hypothetical protein